MVRTVHGTNGLHMVRIVHGTNSQWYEKSRHPSALPFLGLNHCMKLDGQVFVSGTALLEYNCNCVEKKLQLAISQKQVTCVRNRRNLITFENNTVAIELHSIIAQCMHD